MLTGEYKHTLDAKGRVFVPAKFRSDLGESVVLLKGFGDYLLMYPQSEYELFMEKVSAHAEERSNMTKFMRMVSMNSTNVDVDAQGRINIGEDYRKAAFLEKEISFVGMRKYVEIWSSSKAAEEYDSADLDEFRRISEELHLGLC